MEELLKGLTVVFRDVLDDDNIVLNEETTAAEIEEWDSLTHIMLISEIEKKDLKIKFTSSEITRFKNVGELANSILSKKRIMIDPIGTLKMHHIGCAVRSIKDSAETYVNILGFKNVSEVYELNEIGIKACFIELNNGVFLELIESIGSDSIVNTYLKKGMSYYHIGYKVTDIDSIVKDLLNKDFKEISTVYSPAFNNRKCVFMYTPEFQMIELIDSD